MAANSPNKTKPESKDVTILLDSIEPARREDSERLIEIMSRLTGERPRIWTGNMIGFGQYHYRYASGHEGDTFLAGFSPRKAEFSIYLMGTYLDGNADGAAALFARLGKFRRGKACLYIKRLSDIDVGVLEELITLSTGALRTHTGA